MIMTITMTPATIQHSQHLLNSFKKLVGRDLIDRTSEIEIQALDLFNAKFVVVSHDTHRDPIFNYGNQAALDLWEFNWQEFTALPSRLSAEPIARELREVLLQTAKTQGYIANYQGIRMSRSGQRFWVENAIIWNVTDDDGKDIGQAATFAKWTPIV
jgi:hypothetical protein